MNKQNILNLIGETLLLKTTQELGKQFFIYLKSIGLTDEEIQLLDKQGSLFYWSTILDDYIKEKFIDNTYYLYDLTIFLAKLMLPNIDDIRLQGEMRNFISSQSIEAAQQIKTSIADSVNPQTIEFIFSKFSAMSEDAK